MKFLTAEELYEQVVKLQEKWKTRSGRDRRQNKYKSHLLRRKADKK